MAKLCPHKHIQPAPAARAAYYSSLKAELGFLDIALSVPRLLD